MIILYIVIYNYYIQHAHMHAYHNMIPHKMVMKNEADVSEY